MKKFLGRIGIDTYILLLIGTVVLATVSPARGAFADIVSDVSYFAIMLLFFLYGSRIDLNSIIAGLSNLRLQSLVLLTTFVVFPVLGILASRGLAGLFPEQLLTGILFLCILPSTVQSSIALTGLAQGNVPAAICAASISNLLGVLLTPILGFVLLSTEHVVINLQTFYSIGFQLLVPFLAGQLARPMISRWVQRQRMLVVTVDRGAILLIVYTTFSAGMVAGIWHRFDLAYLLGIGLVDILLLAAVLFLLTHGARIVDLPQPDRVAAWFCGSQKSLATGVPIALVMFPKDEIAIIILPLMLYHQIQLIVSVMIANRQAAALTANQT